MDRVYKLYREGGFEDRVQRISFGIRVIVCVDPEEYERESNKPDDQQL